MPPNLKRMLAALIALIALGGFAWLYACAAFQCWRSDDPTKIIFSPPHVYLATVLAGLVGGVTAMIFNEKLPDPPSGGGAGGNPGFVALRRSLTVEPKPDFLAIMSILYVIGYLVTGVFAIVTWIKFSDKTPDLIKNLALVDMGLMVAVARSFFTVS